MMRPSLFFSSLSDTRPGNSFDAALHFDSFAITDGARTLVMTDSQDLSSDDRESARVQLPFEVELSHPSLGKIRSVARDISQSGIFVRLNPTGLRPGAKIKVTVVNAALVESNPTPTIEMEVARVTEEGLGLKFTNRTSQHLWQSVDRLRQDLRLGQDYFQVFQGVAIVNHFGQAARRAAAWEMAVPWRIPHRRICVAGFAHRLSRRRTRHR